MASTAFQLGVTLSLDGRPEDAEALLWRALDIEMTKRGADDVRAARALHELGLSIRLSRPGPGLEGGRLEEATELFARALAIKEARLGPDDPSVGETLYELGVCFGQEGKQDEAEAFLRRALGIKKAAALGAAAAIGGGKGAGGSAPVVVGGGGGAAAATATAAHERGKSKTGGKGRSTGGEVGVAPAMFQLGVCLLQSGRKLEEAETLLRNALAIEEERLGENQFLPFFSLFCLHSLFELPCASFS